MKTILNRGLARTAIALGGVLLVASSCAHVKQDQLDRELNRVQSELREEIREGDAAVEQRLGDRISDLEMRMDARLATLERDLNALRDEFNVTVERLETAIRFNAPVHFAFDDDQVRPEDRLVLERFAEVVQNYYSNAVITVEGFTDSSGDPAYNLALGQRRAESVKAFLAQRGLPENRMRAVSYGEAQERQIVPGVYGPGTQGWQNRRVAMVVDFQGDLDPSRVVATSNDGR
jgi:outer membrane protein OmpA-like peptidoglycan-associated protein